MVQDKSQRRRIWRWDWCSWDQALLAATMFLLGFSVENDFGGFLAVWSPWRPCQQRQVSEQTWHTWAPRTVEPPQLTFPISIMPQAPSLEVWGFDKWRWHRVALVPTVLETSLKCAKLTSDSDSPIQATFHSLFFFKKQSHLSLDHHEYFKPKYLVVSPRHPSSP